MRRRASSSELLSMAAYIGPLGKPEYPRYPTRVVALVFGFTVYKLSEEVSISHNVSFPYVRPRAPFRLRGPTSVAALPEPECGGVYYGSFGPRSETERIEFLGRNDVFRRNQNVSLLIDSYVPPLTVCWFGLSRGVDGHFCKYPVFENNADAVAVSEFIWLVYEWAHRDQRWDGLCWSELFSGRKPHNNMVLYTEGRVGDPAHLVEEVENMRPPHMHLLAGLEPSESFTFGTIGGYTIFVDQVVAYVAEISKRVGLWTNRIRSKLAEFLLEVVTVDVFPNSIALGDPHPKGELLNGSVGARSVPKTASSSPPPVESP